MGLDLVHENEIGDAAVNKLFEKLKTIPLILQMRNVDLTVGTTKISGGFDLNLHVGDILEWAKIAS
jgi:hypothetical protein